MTVQRHTTGSVEETWELGETLGKSLRPGDVVALRGELGAGKTQLVRGIARGLGIDPGLVHSPTFVVMNEYAASGGAGGGASGERPGVLIHVDAYRLSGEADAETIGLDEAFASGAVVVVEWPERIEHLLPKGRIEVSIEHAGETSRVITVGAGGGAEGGVAASSAGVRRCRTCGAVLAGESDAGVFCSERCRLADLGKWFSGSYSISRELRPDDPA